MEPEEPLRVIEGAEPSSSLPAGRILLGGLLGLLLALVLNASVLVHEAETKPTTNPKVPAEVWRPFESVASALQLDRPRELADEALGRERFDEIFELPVGDPDGQAANGTSPTTAAPTTNAPAAPVPTTSVEDEGGTDGASAEDGTAPTTSTPEDGAVATTAVPTTQPATSSPPTSVGAAGAIKVATSDDRLDLWVGGDSMTQTFGESLLRIATGTNVIEPELDSRVSTGLTRPDFFDWPRHLNDILTAEDAPEVVVIMFGANDAQGITLANGDIFQFGDEGWFTEYRRRVNGTMQLLTADPGRRIVWVGQPSARDGEFSARMERLNVLFREEASRFDGIDFLDTWALFNDADGGYEAFLPTDGGEVVNMRQTDGFHLSRPGGDRLAVAVLRRVGDVVDLSQGDLSALG